MVLLMKFSVCLGLGYYMETSLGFTPQYFQIKKCQNIFFKNSWWDTTIQSLSRRLCVVAVARLYALIVNLQVKNTSVVRVFRVYQVDEIVSKNMKEIKMSWCSFEGRAKGQLISKAIFHGFQKKPTKFCTFFCPSLKNGSN